MAQYHIHFLYNTKVDLWVLLGGTLCQLMDQLRPKTGNPLAIFFGLYFINIMSSCCFKKSNHGTGVDHLSEKHKG